MAVTKILRYAVLALPVTVASLVRSPSGRWRAAASLVPSALSLIVLLFMVFVAWSGYLYPLRPDTIGALGHPFTPDARLANSWGGTRLIGAWFIHASVALGWHVACLGLLRLTGAWHGRLLRDQIPGR